MNLPIPPDDITLNKGAIIERCLRRIREELTLNPALDHATHVDALTLNLERACQAAIDLAMHWVARHKLGMPQTSAEAFNLLQKAGYINEELSRNLSKMVSFRNRIIHEYQTVDTAYLRQICENRLVDLVELGANFGLAIDI